jgi:hypothetical protein
LRHLRKVQGDVAKILHGQLAVDQSGLGRAVTQEVPDDLESSSLPDKGRGSGMAEDGGSGAGSVDSSPKKGLPHHVVGRSASDRTSRGTDLLEDVAVRTFGAPMAEVDGERIDDWLHQGKTQLAPGLVLFHAELSPAPVDVIELEPDQVGGP